MTIRHIWLAIWYVSVSDSRRCDTVRTLVPVVVSISRFVRDHQSILRYAFVGAQTLLSAVASRLEHDCERGDWLQCMCPSADSCIYHTLEICRGALISPAVTDRLNLWRSASCGPGVIVRRWNASFGWKSLDSKPALQELVARSCFM